MSNGLATRVARASSDDRLFDGNNLNISTGSQLYSTRCSILYLLMISNKWSLTESKLFYSGQSKGFYMVKI